MKGGPKHVGQIKPSVSPEPPLKDGGKSVSRSEAAKGTCGTSHNGNNFRK